MKAHRVIPRCLPLYIPPDTGAGIGKKVSCDLVTDTSNQHNSPDEHNSAVALNASSAEKLKAKSNPLPMSEKT